MTKKDESVNGAKIAAIARDLLGPEETWDDADSEFAMRLFGVEPNLSTKEIFDLILGVIEKFEKNNEKVPPSLVNVLTQLANKLKREDPWVETTLAELKERLSQQGSKGLAAAVGKQRFRGKKKLSKKDEKILRELEDELLKKDQDETNRGLDDDNT
jgi:hypothetical protein